MLFSDILLKETWPLCLSITVSAVKEVWPLCVSPREGGVAYAFQRYLGEVGVACASRL